MSINPNHATAPRAIAPRSTTSASSINYQATTDGFDTSLHKMINLFPYFYKWSANEAYQINPDYVVHYVYLDAPVDEDPFVAKTLSLELPYIEAFTTDTCLFIVYLRNTRPNDVFRFFPIDPSCSINRGNAGAAMEFLTDDDDHMFFVYGAYNNSPTKTMNKYFIKRIQGREVELTSGTGISISRDHQGDDYVISALPASQFSSTYLITEPIVSTLTLLPEEFIIMHKGRIRDFRGRLTAGLAVDNNVIEVIVRKNGNPTVTINPSTGLADSAMRIVFHAPQGLLPANTASRFEDHDNYIPVEPGDRISFAYGKSHAGDHNPANYLKLAIGFVPVE